MTFSLKRYRRLLGGAAAALLIGGFISAQDQVTRVEIKSGNRTITKDIVHGMPDFFNGETPVLKVVRGAKQPKASGFLPQPIVIAVYHADGVTPWPLAPVAFAVEYGAGGWAATRGGTVTTKLALSADSSGVVAAYYWMP